MDFLKEINDANILIDTLDKKIYKLNETVRELSEEKIVIIKKYENIIEQIKQEHRDKITIMKKEMEELYSKIDSLQNWNITR